MRLRTLEVKMARNLRVAREVVGKPLERRGETEIERGRTQMACHTAHNADGFFDQLAHAIGLAKGCRIVREVHPQQRYIHFQSREQLTEVVVNLHGNTLAFFLANRFLMRGKLPQALTRHPQFGLGPLALGHFTLELIAMLLQVFDNVLAGRHVAHQALQQRRLASVDADTARIQFDPDRDTVQTHQAQFKADDLALGAPHLE